MKKSILVAILVCFGCCISTAVLAEDTPDYKELYLKSQLQVAKLSAVIKQQTQTIELFKLALQRKNNAERQVLVGPTQKALQAYLAEKKAKEPKEKKKEKGKNKR